MSFGAHYWGIVVTHAIAPSHYLLFPPFHYVIAKMVPAMQLAAHAKCNTLYGRSYGLKSKNFKLDRLLLSRIIMGLLSACCELLYKHSNLKTVARDREIDYWIQN